MSDERFVEQHAKYTPAIENNINTSIERFSLCILIGGKETDLFHQVMNIALETSGT